MGTRPRRGDTLGSVVIALENAFRNRSERRAARGLSALVALVLAASVAVGCKPRRTGPADAGAQPATTAAATTDEAPPPPAPPTAANDAADAAVFQRRGELLDSDVRGFAQQALEALQRSDVAALSKITAPGVDAAALVKKLKGQVGEGPPKFEDAILTPDLVELRYRVTYDVDASAPRYIKEVHLMFKRVEGFLPWRLSDAFAPGT
jgi:hypothetical protein